MDTRIFFTTDIHGSEKCFRKFVNSGKFYNTKAIILGGDLTGKMVIPIVKKGDNSFVCHFVDNEYNLNSLDQLETMEKRIRDSGFYPYQTTRKEIEEINADPKKLNSLFSELMLKTLRQWIELAEERLKGTGIQCYITGGNDDLFNIEPILNNAEYIVNPEGKVVNIDEHHEMISSGYSNITPWECPRDIPEEELAKKIDQAASQVENMKNCIFNLHVPPYDSGIDTAVELDEKLRPVTIGGQVSQIPVGSTAVRTAIEKYQPLLGLHGHIHESRGDIKIGRTLCINPGSEYGEGILRGVIINLNKKGIKSLMLTSG